MFESTRPRGGTLKTTTNLIIKLSAQYIYLPSFKIVAFFAFFYVFLNILLGILLLLEDTLMLLIFIMLFFGIYIIYIFYYSC